MQALWGSLNERVMTIFVSGLLLLAVAANGVLIWTLSRPIVVGVQTLEAERPIVVLGVELDRARVPRRGQLAYHVEMIRTRAGCVGRGTSRWLISATGSQHRMPDERVVLGEPGHTLRTITMRLPELPRQGGDRWRLMSTLSFECDGGMRHVGFSTPYFELIDPDAGSR
jgi:hypothetical protein